MTMQKKTADILFKDFIKSLDVKKGDIIKSDQFFTWIEENHPEVKGDAISTYLLTLSSKGPDPSFCKIPVQGEEYILFQTDGKDFYLSDSKGKPDPPKKETTLGTDELAHRKDIEAFNEADTSDFELGMKLFR